MWHFFHLEMISGWRNLAESLQAAAFYGLVVLFFVLAQPPGLPAVPERSGILWASIVIIFALLHYRLLARDYASGFLEQWPLLPVAMEWLVLLKCAAHWLTVVIPLLLLTPLLALMLGLDFALLPSLMLSLAIGLAAMAMLGCLAASASLAFRGGDVISVMLVLPLALPLLILGSIAATKTGFSSELNMLCGYALVVLPLGSGVSARLIRYAVE